MILVSFAAFASREDGHHALRLESLSHQIAVQTLELAIVGDGVAAAQAFGQRRLDERVTVRGTADLVDDPFGDRSGDAGAFNLQAHAQPASAPDRCFRARNRFGHARVVDGALLAEAVDGAVDVLGGMAATGEAVADLSFGELAAREHPQAVDVRGVALRIRSHIG